MPFRIVPLGAGRSGRFSLQQKIEAIAAKALDGKTAAEVLNPLWAQLGLEAPKNPSSTLQAWRNSINKKLAAGDPIVEKLIRDIDDRLIEEQPVRTARIKVKK